MPRKHSSCYFVVSGTSAVSSRRPLHRGGTPVRCFPDSTLEESLNGLSLLGREFQPILKLEPDLQQSVKPGLCHQRGENQAVLIRADGPQTEDTAVENSHNLWSNVPRGLWEPKHLFPWMPNPLDFLLLLQTSPIRKGAWLDCGPYSFLSCHLSLGARWLN